MEICKGYFDGHDREYKIGDIVYNPYFNDYWVVYKSKPEYNFECPYCLLLWNSEDEDVEELDTPKGFLVVCSIDEEEYDNALEYINKIAKKRREYYNE